MQRTKFSSTLALWMSILALSISSVHPVYAGDLTDQQKTELQALEKIQAQENAGRQENTQSSRGISTSSGSTSYSVPAPAYHNVTGISIDTNSVNLQVGCTTHINAQVLPGNANNKGISWFTNNDQVATVDGNGTIYARSAGSATITARTNENGYTAYIYVNAYNPEQSKSAFVHVDGVSVNPKAVTLAINQYMYITPTVNPSNASDKSVVWYSSNPKVCPVSTDGKIIGTTPGSAIITCWTMDGGKTATTKVTVANVYAGQVAPSPAQPAPAAQKAQSTHSAEICYNTVCQILAAPQKGTILITADRPMAYDTNVAAAMKMRPDVTVVAGFPFQGHYFHMALPAGYDLNPVLDKTGYVDWLVLCGLKNVTVAMLK